MTGTPHARQIAYFLAVAEHGGFGRAAMALRVAQPTLSQSIRALERDLGADLFHRATQGVALTAAGRALLGPARRLLRDVSATRESAGGRRETPIVDLLAAAPLGVHPGAPLVASFLVAHPGITVRLDRPDSDDALPTAVRDGVSELGLCYLPVPRLELAAVELGTHELMVVFPPGLDPGPGAVPLRRLAEVGLIGPPRGTWQRGLVEEALRAARVGTRLVMEIAQRDTIAELVLAGVGVAFLTDQAAPAVAARGAHVRPVDPPLRRAYGLVHRREPLSRPAAALLAHARQWAGF